MALFYKDLAVIHRIYKDFNYKPYGIDFLCRGSYTIGMRVMIADDDELVRGFLRRCFERAGCEVEDFSSGAALLEGFSRRAPDLIVSDFNMPGALNGLKACQAIRRAQPSANIVFITGDPANVPVIREAGFERVLAKPFDIEDLDKLVLL